MKQLDEYVVQLLHTDEPGKNRLVDLDAGDASKTYYLSLEDCSNLAEYITLAVKDRIGKPGNMILRASAIGEREQVVGRGIRALDWRCGDGTKDIKSLHKFIDGVYKDIKNKGNNPLFLSVGEIQMQARVSSTLTKIVRTPVLIYPIKLVRSSSSSPVTIEFIDDEIYINPCLIEKLKDLLIGEGEFCFPHPNGELISADEPISVDKLDDGNAYYGKVAQFVSTRSQDENSVFSFNRDTVAIAQYNHDDLCMYYDVKRNREKIENHPQVKRLFSHNDEFAPTPEYKVEPRFTLAYDTVQKEMITRVVNGESVIIKGPPGTGKTLTIANMISALLAENKKVLFASKKLAALDEVYNKIPDELKKFALLLDCESELAASKINPAQVRRDLKDLLLTRSTTALDDKVYAELNQASVKLYKAQSKLDEYEKETFLDTSCGGLSYYDALNISAKYDLPSLEFIPPQVACVCPREVYLSAKDKVVECGKYFDLITQNRTYGAKTNPFYGIRPSDSVPQIVSALAPISEVAQKIVEIIDGVETDGVKLADLTLADLYALSYASADFSEVGKLVGDTQTKTLYEKLALVLSDYDTAMEKYSVSDEDYRACLTVSDFPTNEKTDMLASVDLINKIVANGEVISEIKWTQSIFNALLALAHDTLAQRKISDDALYRARAVLKPDLSEKEIKFVKNAYQSLAPYLSSQAEKPKFFDIKAKLALGQIDKLTIMDMSFNEKVKAVVDYDEYLNAQDKIKANTQSVCKIFRAVLSPEQIELITAVVNRCKELGLLPGDYVAEMLVIARALKDNLATLPPSLTLGKIKSAKEIERKENAVLTTLDYARELGYTVDKAVPFARNLYAYCAVVSIATNNETAIEIYDKFARNLGRFGATLRENIDKFIALNGEFSINYYPTEFTKRTTPYPLVLRFISLSGRIDSATDAHNYALALESNGLSLGKFFTLLDEQSDGKEISYEKRFEHTFYSLASTAVADAIGKTVGSEIDLHRELLTSAEDEIEKANAKLIENMLLNRIDTQDPDYAFLQMEKDASALRLLFKNHARAILKLKPCMILSPSSVSVLMRPSEYENFDVVIVDEASQLEPVSVLPAMFRARSCVIVGDEHQMPPIQHFKIVEESPDAPLPPSVLALALNNNAFIAQELRCHYRSKTESLIRFSQGRYYSAMRTFPALTPKTETLGFTDIYTQDGYCDGGVNLAEAKAVVDAIAEHYEKYYQGGKVERTLGVVAFGENQIKKIKSLAVADERLKKYRHNPENESVGIFYRTVEKVQGQEADALIISITYGKTASGNISLAFGELNRKEFGERIFNVAVTRAKESVTLIHSILPEQFNGESVPFIAEYIRTAMQFAGGGKEQFVEKEVGLGFISSVADYIASLGLDRERIITGYGVTEGSVRIPIAILSKDKTRALGGIWCERNHGKEYDYTDLNVRHYESLVNRDWKLTTVYAHDWKKAREESKENIKKFISEIVKD